MVDLSVADVVVGEGDGFARLTVALSSPVTQRVTVAYAAQSGTASGSGYDFENTSGTLSFAPGETSKTVQVQLSQYSAVESLEEFYFKLSSPTNAAIERGTAMVTVIDNDTVVDTPRLFVKDIVVDEKDGTARFVVALGQALGESSNSTVTVDWALQGGTAIAGSDFVATSGRLSFAPGESVKTVVVDLIDDAQAEGLERFSLVLSNASGATIADGVALAEIGANDGTATSQPRLSVQDRVIGEGDGYIDFVVSLNQPGQNIVTVAYATQSGTASGSGYDFENTSGTLSFAPGETTKTVRIPISQYSAMEGLEYFRFDLSSPSNAAIERGSAMITVIDNDIVLDTPEVVVRDVSVDEKAGTASFVVSLGRSVGQSSNSTVTVDYRTIDGTARSGQDFVAASGTLSFASGESVKTVVVDLIDDALAESTERFGLYLSQAVGATVVDAMGSAEIGASDGRMSGQPTLTARAPVLMEGDGYVDVVVSLSTPSSNRVTVNYTTQSGTAVGSGYDFENASGTLSFEPGVTTQVVRIELATYQAKENTEQFKFVLSSPVGAALAASTLEITILDDDAGDGVPIHSGGFGDDLYLLATPADHIVEGNAGGVDTVLASFSYVLPDGVENLFLTGSQALSATGNAAANVLRGNEGNNRLDGQGGIDTAVFAGARAAYSPVGNAVPDTISGPADGTDTLLSIERLQFSDQVVAFDTSSGGNTHAAYAMFHAAFNTGPTASQLGQWTAELDRLGSTRDLAQAMINFYAPSVTDDVLVSYLWLVTVGQPISPGDLASFVDLLANGTYSQASLLEMVATHSLNTSEFAGLVGQPMVMDVSSFPLLA